MTGRDEVRVLDYGVIEVTGVEDSPYSAPEQQRGGGDLRSDGWAIGVLLCELITGQRAGDEPPRVDAIADLRQGVRDLVHKALAADPGQRYADLAAMRAAMCGLLGIEYVAVQPAAPPASRSPKAAARVDPSPAGAEPPLHGGGTEPKQRDVRRDTAPPPARRTMPPPASPSAPAPRSAMPASASPPPLLPPLEGTQVLALDSVAQAPARTHRTGAQVPVPASDGTQVLALDSLAQAPAGRTHRTGAQVPVPASDGTQVLALDSLAQAAPAGRKQKTGAQVPVPASDGTQVLALDSVAQAPAARKQKTGAQVAVPASDGTQVLALDSVAQAPAARKQRTGAQVPVPAGDRTEVVALDSIVQAAQAARTHRTGAQAPVPAASDRTGVTSRRAVNGAPAAAAGARSGTGSQRALARPEPSFAAEPPTDSTVVARSPLPPPSSRPPAAMNGVTQQAARGSSPSPAMSTFVGPRSVADSTMILQAPELLVRPSEPDRTVIWRPPDAPEDEAEPLPSRVEPELPRHDQTMILAPEPVPPKAPRLAAAAGWPLRTKLLVVNVALAVVILVGVIVAT
ncbi:hypothetical protein [Nannocystis punicea]|uniref:Protein kinase domain-containing protein n=1 Tax=Nannocystis punicea TaxID=2995304 RepID=A0ABY7GST5_9BACT|nr:hypothetical protein [Nannocystis poenicansa]WAS90015.1 hypothetical protein O0S08_27795 [Nannocystis poenicansa]